MRISLSQAIQKLNHGEVVALPTETVYGLAASLNDSSAIEKIFTLKNRPLANPLIVHCAHLEQIKQFALNFPPQFEELSQIFWPGPLRIVLESNLDLIPSIVRAGLKTVGFRIPQLELTRQVICKTGPLVMPSANLSGKPSSTLSEHIENDFGSSFPVLEGGECKKGLESTIIIFQDLKWKIIRLGAIQPETFLSVLGYCPEIVDTRSSVTPLCPGQLFRHYAPQAKLYFDEKEKEKCSHLIGFKERLPADSPQKTLCLGSVDNPQEVAKNLYQVLRQLDLDYATSAWIDMNFPQEGLWITIAERLKRAGQK